MSKFGLIASGAYILFVVACHLASRSTTSDAKGELVIRQLPIAIQGALLDAIGLGEWLSTLGWVGAYAVIGGGTLLVMYLIGALTEKLLQQ